MRIIALSYLLLISCSNIAQRAEVPGSDDHHVYAKNSSLLVNLIATDRISSNHYADIVTDEAGNSYIACFNMKVDRKDYILIQKINPEGVVEWEMGGESAGRATSIAISESDQIFVTGYFSSELQLGNQRVTAEGDKMFIAQITPAGDCTNILINEGKAIAFDISVNRDGYVLIGGQMETALGFGKVSMQRADDHNTGFLALFKTGLHCIWIREFDGQISRIKSQQNHFYITGAFNSVLHYGSDTLYSTHTYDQDGFLLSLNAEDNTSWLKQFGTPGFIKNGYRTHDKGGDIAFDEKGNILIAGFTNTFKIFDQADLTLLKFNVKGEQLIESIILSGVEPGVLTFSSDARHNYWLSGSSYFDLCAKEKQSAGKHPASFILQLSPDLEIKNITCCRHEDNMLFRSSYVARSKIIFSGHYRGILSIDTDTIRSDAKHELFIYAFNTEE